MSLQSLQISQLRNIKLADLSFSPAINLFYGANGAGKTSILEAIHILSLGRSFRSHKHKSLIQYETDAFTLFSVIEHSKGKSNLGLSRSKLGELNLRCDGQSLQSVAQMAALLPIQTINSDSFLLLEGSPQVRRQFMDWLVFHVEHEFYGVWKRLQTCLKQRNSLLRCGRIDLLQLDVWDQELVVLTDKLHQLRTSTFNKFLPIFNKLVVEFLAIDGLTLIYKAGWDERLPYQESLAANRDRDIRLGITHVGSHRAELKLSIHGQDAADVLSRGQQKLLVCALKIAQAIVFSEHKGEPCIFLIDDLPAELDKDYRHLVCHWLDQMQSQVFVTGVESNALLSTWSEVTQRQIKLFHVEHGIVSESSETPH